MLEVFFAADVKSGPARVGNPAVLLGKTLCQERIANLSGKGNVNDPADMDVSNFRASEAEFSSAKAMRMNGYVRPPGDFLFEPLQIIHSPNPRPCYISMPENDPPIHWPGWGGANDIGHWRDPTEATKRTHSFGHMASRAQICGAQSLWDSLSGKPACVDSVVPALDLDSRISKIESSLVALNISFTCSVGFMSVR
jgi:hypothetical protein